MAKKSFKERIKNRKQSKNIEDLRHIDFDPQHRILRKTPIKDQSQRTPTSNAREVMKNSIPITSRVKRILQVQVTPGKWETETTEKKHDRFE